jgi:ERF superfamily
MAEHKTLWEALLAFKAEAPPLPKEKFNPHFKSRYTSLDTVAEKIDPLLTKHGLVWVALPGYDNGNPTLEYQLVHAASGEALRGVMLLMLDRENSQGLGSALTYCRRYAKMAALDLVADEDDDGNRASVAPAEAGSGRSARQPAARPVETHETKLSTSQRGMLLGRAAEAGLDNAQFANAILAAGGAAEPREFSSDEDAKRYLHLLLDRMPVRLFDPVMTAMGFEKQGKEWVLLEPSLPEAP